MLIDSTSEKFTRASAVDGEEIFETNLSYCELVTIAGVSNIPDLCGADHDSRPPAASVMGRAGRTVLAIATNVKAVFSIFSPHQLRIVTKELRDLFEYNR